MICSCERDQDLEDPEIIQALPFDDSMKSQTISLHEDAELLNVGYMGNINDDTNEKDNPLSRLISLVF